MSERGASGEEKLEKVAKPAHGEEPLRKVVKETEEKDELKKRENDESIS
jgi:hypothetical protein